MGKSVLLEELERLARDEGWAVVRHQLEPRHNTDESLSQLIVRSVEASTDRMSRVNRLKAHVSDAVEVGRRLLTVSVEDVTFSLGGETQVELDLARSLYQAVEAALDTGHEGFALLLDEAQVIRDETGREGEHPVSMLVAAVNALQEAGLPSHSSWRSAVGAGAHHLAHRSQGSLGMPEEVGLVRHAQSGVCPSMPKRRDGAPAPACAQRAAVGPASLVLPDVSAPYFETDKGHGLGKPGFSKQPRLDPRSTNTNG